jgi:hypothetical protein
MNVLDPAFEEDSYVIPLRIFLVIGGVCMLSKFLSGQLACEPHGQVSELPRIKLQLLAFWYSILVFIFALFPKLISKKFDLFSCSRDHSLMDLELGSKFS